MKTRSLLFIASIALVAVSCKNRNAQIKDTVFTISPFNGYTERDGKPVNVKVSYPESFKPDSIVYLLDSVKLGSREDSTAISFKTDTLRMGIKNITAKVYKDGKSKDIKTGVVIMPVRMPSSYTYKVIKKFPHDTTAFTEGLSYDDGYLYESTGNEGKSEIRKVMLETGKVVERQKLGDKYVGTGSTVVGDKILMFTMKDKIGFVFDKKTVKPLTQFKIGTEAWGATTDGKKIYLNNGTNRVLLLDQTDYHQIGFIDVFDHNAAVNQIDELEYFNGKLYATINPYDTIIEIDPKTGAVVKAINMTDIYPEKERPKGFDGDKNVLNGIAYDAAGKRLFVTGRKWPYVYQIEIVKNNL
ncbi:glutaminyl-peptide cyclotransferase [Mucilaginibacter sp. UR6-11]|uniref:glutaminyl-peptide cyclotransferase n=1 Tax=Mucilaginibacter sp. UR6-11 TaxID=1435644 RepID=UPI001E653915|nr:glutaminyl-peptide cyclotransferase [Mucilaginibacter sp. UR6-11]MCC8425106.1 glutaminyl-peptide cyclotransferase [Mucilaginibacter sp. UR6-11]